MLTRAARTAIAALAVIAATGTWGAGPAAAHGELVRSEPEDGATLTALPARLVLEFNNAVFVEPGAVVLHTDDREVQLAAYHEGSDSVLVAELPADVSDGPIEVRWRVSGADGHVTAGAIGFGLNVATPSSVAGAGVPKLGMVRAALNVSRLIAYLATAVLVGGGTFLAVAWPAGAAVARARQVLAVAVGFGLAASLAWIALQGALIRRAPAATWSADAWLDVVRSPAGRAWAGRGLLFVLAVPALVLLRRDGIAALRSPTWLAGAAAVAVGLLRMPGFTSHASEGDHPLLGLTADFVHLGAVAVWLGGLVLVATVVLPRRQAAELAAVLPRFSRVAMISVATLVTAGLVLTWLIVGDASALTSTRFGRLLDFKLALFAALTAAAEGSRRWTGRRIPALAQEGAAAVVRPFALSVAAEVALAIAVLAVASALVTTNPGI